MALSELHFIFLFANQNKETHCPYCLAKNSSREYKEYVTETGDILVKLYYSCPNCQVDFYKVIIIPRKDLKGYYERFKSFRSEMNAFYR